MFVTCPELKGILCMRCFNSYLFSAVETIIRNHQKEEIKRRMSHGEILKLNQDTSDNTSGVHLVQQNQATSRIAANFVRSANNFGLNRGTSSNSSSTSVNEYKNVMTDKPDYFKASVMVRSTSSSSNTSRWKYKIKSKLKKLHFTSSLSRQERKQLLWLNERMRGDLEILIILFIWSLLKKRFTL